jgi:glycosyltransferase involved in cell wall biosynthesis
LKLWKWYFSTNFSPQDVVIEVHNFNLLPYFFFDKKVRHLHIIHDLFYYDYDKNCWKALPVVLGWIIWLYYATIHKWLYQRIFKSASRIIAISEATKQEILVKYGKQFTKNISIIHNGVDVMTFQPTKKNSL